MNFKQIASYDNFMLANMTMGMFTENGIKCHLKDEYIVTMDPLLNPVVGGIKLLVEEKDYDRALDLMRTTEEDYVKDIACPKCNIHALSVEEKINKPEGFWGKLKNQLAYGQTETYSKKFRCTHCNHLLDELPPSF